MKSGDKDGVFLRTYPSGKEVWWFRFTWMGRDIKRKGGKTKEEAKKARRAMLTDLERGVMKLHPTNKDTLAEVFKRYRDIAQHHRNYSRTEAYYAFWTAQIGALTLRALTPFHVEQAQQVLLKGKRAPSTVNHYTSWLRAVLSREVRLGNLLQNPFSRVRQLRESKGRLRYLSVEEEQRLLAAIGPLRAPWVRLAILTGLRQDEQFSLKWDQVDLERGIMTLPETKAGGVQYALLNRQARDILEHMQEASTSEWVFPSKTRETHLEAKNFYNRIYVPALMKAGLRKKKGKNSPPEDPGQRVDWHTLRHTFASRLAMQAVPLGTIAALLRHSGTGLVQRYAHLSPGYLAGAIEEVSRFGMAGLEHGDGTRHAAKKRRLKIVD